MSARHGIARTGVTAATLGLLLTGCSFVEEPPTTERAFPGLLTRRDTEAYLKMDTISITEGSRRWLVAPRAILELTDGFLNFEFTEEEGLAGSILSVAQDRDRIWIGTTRGVQSLDKELHFIRTYVEDPNLNAMYVEPYRPGWAVAMGSRGAILVDAQGLNVEIHPAPEIDIREVTDAMLYDDELWVATLRGLHRFSIQWKSWNGTFGGKEIKQSRILRLERVHDVVGDQIVGETLYAVTETGLFIYSPTFDTWERVGL